MEENEGICFISALLYTSILVAHRSWNIDLHIYNYYV